MSNVPETPPELLEELAAEAEWNKEMIGAACTPDNKECEACQ